MPRLRVLQLEITAVVEEQDDKGETVQLLQARGVFPASRFGLTLAQVADSIMSSQARAEPQPTERKPPAVVPAKGERRGPQK